MAGTGQTMGGTKSPTHYGSRDTCGTNKSSGFQGLVGFVPVVPRLSRLGLGHGGTVNLVPVRNGTAASPEILIAASPFGSLRGRRLRAVALRLVTPGNLGSSRRGQDVIVLGDIELDQPCMLQLVDNPLRLRLA